MEYKQDANSDCSGFLITPKSYDPVFKIQRTMSITLFQIVVPLLFFIISSHFYPNSIKFISTAFSKPKTLISTNVFGAWGDKRLEGFGIKLRLARFERAAYGLGIRCSILLSYRRWGIFIVLLYRLLAQS